MNDRDRRTPEQQQVVDQIQEIFQLDDDDAASILFLDDRRKLKPWFPYDVALAIARQSPALQDVREDYVDYIVPLQQVVHSATVTDVKGRNFTRPGVARIGEKLPNEDIPDEHKLAGSRAINAALDTAGFNPLKATSNVLDLKLPSREEVIADEAESRRKDIARIHILAAQKGLIVPSADDATRNDLTGYRAFLQEGFGINTTAGMGPADRARVINALTEYQPLATAKIA